MHCFTSVKAITQIKMNSNLLEFMVGSYRSQSFQRIQIVRVRWETLCDWPTHKSFDILLMKVKRKCRLQLMHGPRLLLSYFVYFAKAACVILPLSWKHNCVFPRLKWSKGFWQQLPACIKYLFLQPFKNIKFSYLQICFILLCCIFNCAALSILQNGCLELMIRFSPMEVKPVLINNNYFLLDTRDE